jgi:hypothetical protein
MALKRRSLLRPGISLAALLTATLLLAACGAAPSSPPGSPTPGSPPTAAPAALARALGRLDSLVVLRSDAFPANHIHFTFPAEVTVTDPLEVRAVAQALLALPAMPSGPFSAPIDLGISYRLVFATAGERLPTIKVAATGTETVQGLGGTRWVARSPGFWRTLGVAMRLPRPAYDAFRGSARSR